MKGFKYNKPQGGRQDGRGAQGHGGHPPGAERKITHQFPVSIRPSDAAALARVKALENNYVEEAKKELSGNRKSLLSTPHPARPSYGTKGRPVSLLANYFPLAVEDGVTFYRYSVTITRRTPGPPPGPTRSKRIIEILLQDFLSRYNHRTATDFLANIFTSENLDSVLDNQLFEIKFRMRGADPEDISGPEYDRDTDPFLYSVRTESTGTVTVNKDITYAQQRSDLNAHLETVNALNIITGHVAKANPANTSIGANRHYRLTPVHEYPPGPDREEPNLLFETHELGRGLVAIRGYFVSVRPATGRFLYNIHVKPAAFYKDDQLVKVISTISPGPVHQKNLKSLADFLRMVSVETAHRYTINRDQKRVYSRKTIFNLATTEDGGRVKPPRVPSYGAGPSEVEFFREDGDTAGYISVTDYFKEKYPEFTLDPKLPVFNVGSLKDAVYIPAEVLTILAGQRARAKLSPTQTEEMKLFAIKSPEFNQDFIKKEGALTMDLRRTLPHPRLTAFSLGIDAVMTPVPGRILQAPKLRYRQKTTSPLPGEWNLRGLRFVAGARVKTWTWLYVNRALRAHWVFPTDPQLYTAMRHFLEALTERGIEIGNPSNGHTLSLGNHGYCDQIDKKIRQLRSQADLQMVFVILPERDNVELYNQVKISCDVKYGLPNVCLQDVKLRKGKPDYFANVALKVNMKLNGANHYLDSGSLGIVEEGKTMLVGLDVTHPSPGSAENAPSVAAIVASIDSRVAQWPAKLALLPGRKEMFGDTLVDLFKSRLTLWRLHNGDWPENIIIYRDGVSEGDYDNVLEHELKYMRQACAETYGNSQPKFTVIVVGKRHHTRFYPQDKAAINTQSSNPMPGTVVDRGITRAWLWDFFLQAHRARKGTARPAHYYVLYDEIFRGAQNSGAAAADQLEALTHNLCYMYARATKAVSICPPAYYADKVADRGRLFLHHLFEPGAPTPPNAAGNNNNNNNNAASASIVLHDKVKDTMFYI